MDAAGVASAVRAELGCDDGFGRVLWRDGVRHVPAFSKVETKGAGISFVGPILITGGL